MVVNFSPAGFVLRSDPGKVMVIMQMCMLNPIVGLQDIFSAQVTLPRVEDDSNQLFVSLTLSPPVLQALSPALYSVMRDAQAQPQKYAAAARTCLL